MQCVFCQNHKVRINRRFVCPEDTQQTTFYACPECGVYSEWEASDAITGGEYGESGGPSDADAGL